MTSASDQFDPEITFEDQLRVERTGSGDAPHARRMRRLINRLLDEAPKVSEDSLPAIECNITIRGLLQPMSGILSIAPEGVLKLLVPPQNVPGQAPMLLEVFVDYADISSIAVHRKVEAAVAPRIIQAS